MCRRTRLTGSSDELTTHQTRNSSSGTITIIGLVVRSARVRANARRAERSCATWIRCEPETSEYSL